MSMRLTVCATIAASVLVAQSQAFTQSDRVPAPSRAADVALRCEGWDFSVWRAERICSVNGAAAYPCQISDTEYRFMTEGIYSNNKSVWITYFVDRIIAGSMPYFLPGDKGTYQCTRVTPGSQKF